MKKYLIRWGILFLLVISSLGTFNLVSQAGKFEKGSHVTVGREIFNQSKVIYLSYLFTWEGVGTPTLEKVELIKNDGTIIGKEDDSLSLRPFISKVDFGSVEEKEAKKEGIVQALLLVEGFKPDDDFSLALRVEPKHVNSIHDIGTVRIYYKKFGQSHIQNISFDEGIITDCLLMRSAY